MYVPHLLYPFICQWTFSFFFPCLGYCEYCCYEYRGACIFLNQSFVQIYVQEWDCWIIQQLYFQFSELISILFSIVAAPTYIPPTVQKGSYTDFLVNVASARALLHHVALQIFALEFIKGMCLCSHFQPFHVHCFMFFVQKDHYKAHNLNMCPGIL